MATFEDDLLVENILHEEKHIDYDELVWTTPPTSPVAALSLAVDIPYEEVPWITPPPSPTQECKTPTPKLEHEIMPLVISETPKFEYEICIIPKSPSPIAAPIFSKLASPTVVIKDRSFAIAIQKVESTRQKRRNTRRTHTDL